MTAVIVAQLSGCGGGGEDGPAEASGTPVFDLVSRWGSGRVDREAPSVRPGDPDQTSHLVSGWGRPENATGEGPSAWVIGTMAEVELVTFDVDCTAVRLRCGPPRAVADRQQTMTVELNGEALGSVALDRGLATYELGVRPGSLRLGSNLLRLHFAWAEAPADHVPGSNDRRRLAAAFDVLELVGGGAGKPRSGHGDADRTAPVLLPGSARVFRLGLPRAAVLYVALDPETPNDLWGEVWVGGGSDGPRRVGRIGPGAGEPSSQRLDLGVAESREGEVWFVARSTGEGSEAPLRWRRALLSGFGGGVDARSNVVLVVVDTLRSDFVGCYGGPDVTPVMDGLAEGGVRFANAYCQIPTTGPSHSSLFTSLPPTRHGVIGNAQRVPLELDTLAESLRLWYRHTAAFVSLGVLKGEWGFSQGFDSYDGSFPVDWFKDAREVTDSVLTWTAQGPPEPFFLWVHYSDPHEPYTPPDRSYPQVVVRNGTAEVTRFAVDGRTVSIPVALEPGVTLLRFEPGEPAPSRRLEVFNLRLAGGEGCTLEARDGWWRDPRERGPRRLSAALPASVALVNPSGQPRRVEVRFYSKELLTPDETRAAYRDEVAFVDRELGRLLGDLEMRGYLERSLVVLTSDHGESLGEHHHVGHISQLYEPLLRVPLMVSFPGRLPAGKVVEQRVTLLDVMPTVHELLGLPAAAGARGRGLTASATGGALDERAVAAATFRPEAPSDLRSILLGGHKLIACLDRRGANELYDLATDPGELVNLADREPAILERLLDLLAEEDSAADPAAGARSPAVALSAEEEAQMRALGYIR